MRGWFDAFRDDGGPTLYAYSNRTSVTGDVPTITICLLFLTVFFAFLVIFPGVRKERFSTFCTVTLSLLVGTVILVSTVGSSWHVANGIIRSSYRAFSREKIDASMGVAIGLDHVNITMRVIPKHNRSLDINFNERFHWIETTDMREHYRAALVKGLPFPILTVAEYLTLDNEGFAWGRFYRSAGYYTNIVLWSAFASWILMNILMVNVPRYGAYTMTITGALMSISTLVFYLLMPDKPLRLRFEDVVLTFELGWCFWLTLIVGCIMAASGMIVSIMDWIYPHKFSTILEMDFDTPYDRHIIIEDSQDTRKRRFKIPRLEEPFNAGITAGSRLLRRLSKRGKEATDENETSTAPGIDNHAFELELAKSIRYSSFMMRTDSKKSTKSVNFRNASTKSQQFLDIPQLPDYEEKTKHFQRTDSKQSSVSSISVASSPKSVNFEESGIPGPSIHPGGPAPAVPPGVAMLRQDSSQSVSSSLSSFNLGMLTRDPSIRKISNEENTHAPVTRNNSGNIIVFHRTDSRGQLQRLKDEVVEIQTDEMSDIW